ncbi:hypothetical protein DOTSEDRAFT_57023 [Dothistroma septosporum NZE10]|uniref:Uncharacterized protein n=1 Tax=Dothistroma septosporum (strain NZE10 / CBS 128990) TaxID=675120 RepID=M2WHX0_DOTSN|nr:hypothetical protein DOTSEDRAFT_57023 [Dothistroma septosporum NZE10]
MKLPVLAALITHAAAWLGQPSCARDQCFRGACERPGPAAASADCYSFLQKTVSYCRSTSYITTTVTVTASPYTATIVVPSTSQATVSSTVVETISAAITDTETVLATTQATSTYQSATSVTVTAVTTITETLTNPNGPAKRSAASCATTISPSRIPTYAAACGGTAGYSSACSCHGVQPGTKTIPGSTTVVTITSRTTVTPTTTASSVSVVLATQIVVATSDVYVTETDYITTTDLTTIETVTTDFPTSTQTAVSTVTITTQNSSPYFYITTSEGEYVYYESSSSTFPLAVNTDTPLRAYIDSQGHLNFGDPYVARVAGSGNDNIYLNANGVALQCTLSNYAAGTGSLQCTAPGSEALQNVFNVCPNDYLYISTAALAACNVVTLTAVPV